MTALRRTFSQPSSSQLLARILDAPDLGARIQRLEAPALARLIEHVGLESAGELVAFASGNADVRR